MIFDESRRQRMSMETASSAELKIWTDEARGKVIQLEIELQETCHVHESSKKRQRKKHLSISRDVKYFRQLLKDLEMKRKNDVPRLDEELRKLKTLTVSLDMESHPGLMISFETVAQPSKSDKLLLRSLQQKVDNLKERLENWGI